MVVCEGFSLGLQVAEHGVQFQLLKDADDIAVDATKEHRHSSAGSEGMRGHFVWDKVDGSAYAPDAVEQALGLDLRMSQRLVCASGS